MTSKTHTFEMNGKAYRTDEETGQVLRSVVNRYRAEGSEDGSAIGAVMMLGLRTGCIEEIG